jgi:hypothetical protein
MSCLGLLFHLCFVRWDLQFLPYFSWDLILTVVNWIPFVFDLKPSCGFWFNFILVDLGIGISMSFVRSDVRPSVFDDHATIKNTYTVLFMTSESLYFFLFLRVWNTMNIKRTDVATSTKSSKSFLSIFTPFFSVLSRTVFYKTMLYIASVTKKPAFIR